VLTRYPAGEANASLVLLTSEFGLVKVRAQGLRKPGAKLAPALQTLVECDAILVRGKEGWRLSGAVLVENWFRLLRPSARERAGRMSALILRLVRGESADAALFDAFGGLLRALSTLPPEQEDAAEVVAALAIVRALGLDDGELSDDALAFRADALTALAPSRRELILRVNRGLKASGL
jgi:recombinational DNA repair protein (RecF pathway)